MCKQREDIWRQSSGNAQPMIKKEAVIINCSEMRTEGTSRPSAGMFPRSICSTVITRAAINGSQRAASRGSTTMWFRGRVKNTSRLSRPARVLMRTGTSSH